MAVSYTCQNVTVAFEGGLGERDVGDLKFKLIANIYNIRMVV